jgi:site-specific recombinase XerD
MMSPTGFHRLIQRLGEAAKMPFRIHPHMLRHASGYKLANDGHDTRSLFEALDGFVAWAVKGMEGTSALS